MEMKKVDLSNRLYAMSAVVAVFLVLALLLNAVSSWKSITGDYSREITVEGTGKATVKPDLASITVGVKTEGEVLEDLVKENTEKVNAIITALKESGVAEDDMTTQNYYVNPKYQYTPERGSFEDGYVVDQSLVVKVRDLGMIGKLTSIATEKGANNVSNISFSVDDNDKAKSEARDKAIANATKKAEQIAKQTGLKLGKVTSFWENEGYYPIEPHYREFAVMAESADSVGNATPPEFMTGTQEVTVNVSLSFRVK